MAPERLYERFTFNSDLYSLGILAFELLTGELPFTGSTLEIAQAHLTQEAPLERVEPAYMQEFIGYLLEKDANTRLRSADEALRLLGCLHQTYVPPQKLALAAATPASLPCATQIQRPQQNWQPRYTYNCHQTADRLWVLSQTGRCWVALGYQNHLDVFADLQDKASFLLLNVGSLRNLSDGSLAYSSGTKLYSLLPEPGKRTLLAEVSRRLLDFDYCPHQQRLVFCDGHSVTVQYLAEGRNYYYPLEHYVLEPKVCLLNQHWFAHTGGYMDHAMVLREDTGAILQRWFLDGPILECTHQQEHLLVLTMNLEHSAGYSLWRLTPDGAQERLRLSPHTEKHCVTPGYLFWLEKTGLYRCDSRLAPLLVATLPTDAVELLSISAEQDFFAIGYFADQAHTALTIHLWENT